MLRHRAVFALACAFVAAVLFAGQAFASFSLSLQNRSYANATIIGHSGNAYTVDANGFITVTAQDDVLPLQSLGFVTAGSSNNDTATGLPSSTINIPILGARNTDGSVLAASAASGKFGVSITLGTSEALVGEAAQGNTKTDNALYEFRLPDNFVAGASPTVTINASYSGSGTAGTKTVAAAAYRKANAGTQGSNLVSASASTITTSAADYTFAVAGSTLNPGDVLVIEVTTVMQETGGSATLTAQVNSVRVN